MISLMAYILLTFRTFLLCLNCKSGKIHDLAAALFSLLEPAVHQRLLLLLLSPHMSYTIYNVRSMAKVIDCCFVAGNMIQAIAIFALQNCLHFEVSLILIK